jgi:peptidoglycan/LPS O-acetylase OafA/YrhL
MKNVIWVGVVNACIFAVALYAGLAFADNGAVLPTDEQAVGLAQQLWNLFVTKQYALALGPVVALVVWGLRKYDTKIPKVGPQVDAFLNKPFVAFLLPTVVAAAGGAGTALAAGKPVVDVLGAIFQASMSAVFSYVGLKKLGEQRAAGATAAAEIQTKTDAIDELKKGG